MFPCTNNITGEETIKILLEEWFCVYEAPKDMNSDEVKVLPWVDVCAGGLGAGKTSGAGTRGVSLNAAIGRRTGYSDTNGGESSNN